MYIWLMRAFRALGAIRFSIVWSGEMSMACTDKILIILIGQWKLLICLLHLMTSVKSINSHLKYFSVKPYLSRDWNGCKKYYRVHCWAKLRIGLFLYCWFSWLRFQNALAYILSIIKKWCTQARWLIGTSWKCFGCYCKVCVIWLGRSIVVPCG